MMPPILPLDDIPAPQDLYLLRKELELSADGLAYELGFAKNGKETVLDWERGFRNGQPFKPTLLAWRCFRLLVAAARAVNMGGVTMAVTYMRAHLPTEAQ